MRGFMAEETANTQQRRHNPHGAHRQLVAAGQVFFAKVQRRHRYDDGD